MEQVLMSESVGKVNCTILMNITEAHTSGPFQRQTTSGVVRVYANLRSHIHLTEHRAWE